MTTPHAAPDYADIAENGERVCGETNSTLGLTCDRRPHAPGTAHYQIDGDATRAWPGGQP